MPELLTKTEKITIAKDVILHLNRTFQIDAAAYTAVMPKEDLTDTNYFGMCIDEMDDFSIYFFPDYQYKMSDGIIVFDSEIYESQTAEQGDTDPDQYARSVAKTIQRSLIGVLNCCVRAEDFLRVKYAFHFPSEFVDKSE